MEAEARASASGGSVRTVVTAVLAAAVFGVLVAQLVGQDFFRHLASP